MQSTSHRLYFLDWIRICAFFLLILYHTGMYYVSWDWHVKSPAAGHAIEPLMMLSSPWRLGLLFFVAGAAARFLLAKLGAASFMRVRSVRLLVPLVFGILVIVPPQPYFEVVEKVAYTGSYLDFMQLYLNAYHGFCRGDDCLILPTWNHLWFLPYLWCYSMLLAAAVLGAPGRLDSVGRRGARLLGGWRALVLPALVLGGLRLLLAERFETTHALIDDWYSHAVYGFLFLLGALVAREDAVWTRLHALRWPALALALGCWALMVLYYAMPWEWRALAPHDGLRFAMRMVEGTCSWSAIAAVCGFARQHMNHDSPRRRYLTEAVFPVYILHQTLIVTIAHLIKPAQVAPVIEAVILVVLTVGLSFAIFGVVRRIGWLRPLFGLPPAASCADAGKRLIHKGNPTAEDLALATKRAPIT